MTMVALTASRILKPRGLPSLSITAEGDNLLAHLTSWHVPVALTERRYANDRISHVQSTTEMSYALNVLYALHFSRHYTENTRAIRTMLDRQGVAIRRDNGADQPTLEMEGEFGSYQSPR